MGHSDCLLLVLPRRPDIRGHPRPLHGFRGRGHGAREERRLQEADQALDRQLSHALCLPPDRVVLCRHGWARSGGRRLDRRALRVQAYRRQHIDHLNLLCYPAYSEGALTVRAG